LVLSSLAYFHAASHHFIETYSGGGLAKFKSDFPIVNHTIRHRVALERTPVRNAKMCLTFDVLVQVVKKFGGDDDLTRKFVRSSETIVKQLLETHVVSEGEFNCLLHNDAWCNNFMFR
jgi:thiamine kinase-like enzyme